MHPHVTTGAAFAAALLALFSQDPTGPAPGGLERVAPTQPGSAAPASPETESPESFEGPLWSERLTVESLDEREDWFDALVALASRDTLALVWLAERSRDERDTGLAWTARMALRAVEDGRLREASSGYPGMPTGILLPVPTALSIPLGELFGIGAAPSHSVVQVTAEPEGVVVTITRHAAGGQTRQVYRGATLEELFAQNPALEREFGQRLRAPGSAALPEAPQSGGTGGVRAPLPGQQAQTLPVPPHRILGVYVEDLSSALRVHAGLGAGVGVHVLGVQARSYAFALGVGPGSILTELNGQTISAQESITEILSAREPGDELRLTWYDAYLQLHRETLRPVE